ncbi:chondroitin sulfate synthase 1 [Harpegnathos saltator]|uniref:Hexosyltransferase n=1 Tax=Harpegnathos saltator TaxID=610380 RepID=E2C9U3_HARSA|nr:chondroitin sulfate synthase 1 [Harpegnathos saltator]XP_011153252.1 chondroitin sulfate synthase 1 [Harpegnathos saltator]XP_011153254.1 chondroitin sulfate synthase 1 [Harpegnathos saltator]XP_011153255.1 chondroitin sulfate synthase 1 [Harpegnathos saltator]XP_011153256.1 chondroitin sulfate synthase 1 [Harpegnathos saltator]XP_025152858.1 chondroitin sulfate synthase 1 [Harpegnathos saltator]EFN75280.1 Chondroitin sulfate synthase 1 [Harpegnathos saltator]
MGEVTYPVMRKRRGLGSAFLGLFVGLLLGFLVLSYRLIVSNQQQQVAMWTSMPGLRSPPRASARNMPRLKDDERINSSTSSLVFVGVMTAQKYLDTRAKAVYETWGKELPGKIAFFSSESSTVPDNCPELPLVPLPRVDDTYPPQKKSFMMLQYMWSNFGDRFEWFLRADDDVYVRTDRLEKLLRSVDSRRAMYIGQAGRGNSEEFGLLSLDYDENFCMGGPGVVLSRETLRRIVPHIKYCLRHLYTTHEDVELGRCVKKYAGIPCTWSYEMQSILYHNSSGAQAFTGNLKKKEVHRAITLHPVKSPPHMYRLHNYMRGLQIQELQQERIRLHRDVHTMAQELGVRPDTLKNYELVEGLHLFPADPNSENYPGDTDVLGVPASLSSFKPATSDEVIPWGFLSRLEYSLTDSNPRRRIHSDIKEGLEDITREVMASINSCSRQRGRVVEERSALYGYRRVNSYGADTILDLLLVYRKYRGRKVTLPVRRHVYLHQHFIGLEIRETVNGVEVDPHQRSDDTSIHHLFRGGFLNLNFNQQEEDSVRSKTINFILPLSGRYEIFQRFLKNYEDICLTVGEKTSLLVVLYQRKDENSFNKTIDLIERLKYKYRSASMDVLSISGEFSRARALDTAVSKLQPDDLMLFIDVDIVFTNSALNRIRLNTLPGRRIYFPIVFSQYNPQVVYSETSRQDRFTINEVSGHWRQYGFGIVSLYKRDYVTIGGLDLSIQGWGKEDVEFYEKAVKSGLDVFRAADRHLVHVYHEIECSKELPSLQFSMCMGSKADTYAGVETLSDMIYANPNILHFAKERRQKRTNPAG